MTKKEVIDYLRQFVTPDRFEKIRACAEQRTRHFTVALEDVNQSLNISAALRSSDCFGIQQVDIIEKKHRYVPNEGVSKGAAFWLTLTRYNQSDNPTKDCFDNLRARGYTIIATTPHKEGLYSDQLPIDRKTALIFGTEESGLSSYALSNADGFVTIPMYGFTGSFNISVSVALLLYELTTRLRKSDLEWKLTADEITDLQVEWLGKSTHRTHEIERFLKEGNNS